MITIAQLLESVDLDFEPRFVTKDECGCIKFFSDTPRKFRIQWICDEEVNVQSIYPPIKISEFFDKPWQECIYEVPRKTTGKIEKLLEQKLTIGKTKYEYPTHAMVMDKINEIIDWINKVDAVNELKGSKNE